MKDIKNYKPLQNTFVIKIPSKTDGGVILPNQSIDIGKFFEVIKASDKCESIKEGTKVLITPDAFDDKRQRFINLPIGEDKEYFQFNERDVLGISTEK